MEEGVLRISTDIYQTQHMNFFKKLLYQRIQKRNARKMREHIIEMQRCTPNVPENERLRTLLYQVRRELEARM